MDEEVYCWRVEDDDGEDCETYDFKTKEEAQEMARYLRSVCGVWVVVIDDELWTQGDREISVTSRTFGQDRARLEAWRKIWARGQKATSEVSRK